MISHNVTLLPSQRTFSAPADVDLLSSAIRQGISLPYGCRDGVCGSCKCKKISGEVLHKPHNRKALNELEWQSGYILPCCAVPQTDVVLESKHIASVHALPVKKMPVRVIEIEHKTHNVVILTLQMPSSDTLEYRAGQYIDIVLNDGKRTKRSYSIANAPHDLQSKRQMVLHIRHLPGGKFTDHVFFKMQRKEILRIEGPFGSCHLPVDEPMAFWPVVLSTSSMNRYGSSTPKPLIFLASGTGFAPIHAMVQELLEKHHADKDSNSPQSNTIQVPKIHIYWGGRNESDLYLHDEWLQFMQNKIPKHWQWQYTPVTTGWVHHRVMADYPDLSQYEVYACGAPQMVAAAQLDFETKCSLSQACFYADSFVSEWDKAQP